MPRRRLLACALLSGLAACNLAPPYSPPSVTVPTAYKEVSGEPPPAAADSLQPDAWWLAFGDETLDRLERQVDAANPDLAATVARYDQARALAAEGSAALFPQAALLGGLSTNKQSKDRPLRGSTQPSYYGDDQLGLAASYEIDLWGKLRNQAAAGRASAQASAADLAAMRLGLQAQLASTYLLLRGADIRIELLRDTIAAYRKALELTERRFEGKIVSSLDVSRAQTQFHTAQAQLAKSVASRALLEHAIATLVGKPASEVSIPPDVTPLAPPAIPAGLPSTLLRRRPDIAAAERAVQAANSRIGVARAAFYPSLSLDLLGGFQTSRLGLLGMSDSFWSAGPDLTAPLFTGGRLKAQESGAYAARREAIAVYRSTVLSAFQDVEDQAVLLRQLALAAAEEDAGVRAAGRSLDVALNRYREGAASYLEVVTAQTALLDAQQTAVDISSDRAVATVRLIRALGGGWDVADLPSDREAVALAPNR